MEVLAYYLPQYHPIPENDEWWEPGFTEWTKVTAAEQLFRGHVQPHLPRDLGFYDLRVPELRAAQADLARANGITGFIYWHYWLGGRRLLERPFAEVLASGEPDLPFCLAWANHSWERRWGTKSERGQMLLEQTYPGPEDDQAHYNLLRTAFADPRYLRIGGKPVFYVFSPGELPDPAAFVERWQTLAEEFGGLYLVAMLVRSDYANHVADGFDAAAYGRLPIDEHAFVPRARRLLQRRGILRGPERHPYAEGFPGVPPATLGGTIMPVVTPNWDNTPRRGRDGLVITGATPERFASQLPGAIDLARQAPDGEQTLIIRSWNEWGEGNYLEPDQEFGHGWLNALRQSLDDAGLR
ncbi:MAG: glycoside hydrolase family 99-like domain-containing protein [Actinomycetes bacterium]